MTDEKRPGLWDLLRGEPLPSERTVSSPTDRSVPAPLRVAAAYAWRLLLIAAAVGVIIWLVIQLKLLVIPLLAGILITALLWPALSFLLRKRLPRWLAIVIVLAGTAVIIVGLLTLVGWQVSQQWHDVSDSTKAAVDALRQYLIDGPLHLSQKEIDGYIKQATDAIAEQSQTLWTGAVAVGSTVGHVGTGAVLTLFILICLLADGAGIWKWALRLFPKQARPAVDAASRNGWNTVVNYARTQLLVATIDAVGIGLGAFFLSVPLAIPIAVLVFLGSFIPIVGAVVTGIFAVFLALVYNGPWIALAMLVVVLGVQQLEGHVLQPFLMGSAVKVHPLAVVLVVAGGSMIAGIAGAMFAVPLAAFVNVVAVTLSSGSWRTGGAPAGDLIWNTVPRERRRRNQ